MDPHIIEGLIIPLAGMATGIILGLPVVRAAVRFIERKTAGGGDPRLRAEVDELRTRVDATEEIRDRLVDLEERIDFTERVLTQQKERARLVKGD
jgi:hypothetical protein